MTCTVIQGDCLEAMTELEDASVDAMITDPPYCSGAFLEAQRGGAKGQGLRSSTRKEIDWFKADNMGTAGLVWLLRAIAFETARVLKPSGSLLCFCDWRMAITLAPAIESAGLRHQNLVVWDKGYGGLGVGFRAQHELILQFTNGNPTYFDSTAGNVLTMPRTRPNRSHPTEKPVFLIERLIRVVCPQGGTVLDPFAGSGTTGVAAANLGRDAILIERDAAYCETARRRLAATESAA